MKNLRIIEDKNEQLLKTENKTENIKEVTDFVREPLSPKVKALIEEIRIIQEDVDYKKVIIRGGINVTYDFSDFKTFKELYRDFCHKEITINDAEMKKNEFDSIADALNNYSPKVPKYAEATNSLLNNAKTLPRREEKLLKVLKKKYFQ